VAAPDRWRLRPTAINHNIGLKARPAVAPFILEHDGSRRALAPGMPRIGANRESALRDPGPAIPLR
jgi:hypothetical protein